MYYFIVNIAGGSGHAAQTWADLRDILKAENTEYKAYRTKRGGDATRLANKIIRKAKASGDTPIDLIVVGGDGTINEVLNGIQDFDAIRLGIIPSGSGNDFARGLEIPKDVSLAWKRIKEGENKRTIDIGEVLLHDRRAGSGISKISHRFGISAGIGLDAIVCKKVSGAKLKAFLNRIGLGQLSYIVVTVISLFTMKKADMSVVISDEYDSRVFGFNKSIFLAAMNMPAEGGGVKMAPTAKLDDGKLSICCAHDVSTLRGFTLLPLLATGKHDGKKGFYLDEGEEIELRFASPMTVHADGEYLGEHREVIFKISDNKLKVF